ncbi:MAG: flavin reductase family protein [Acidobacteria bacterium]|nr:flavin reductase family protein [Acidobacteriota bacterium]
MVSNIDSIDSDLYRKVCGQYPTGVTVVTGLNDGQPAAMVIGTFVSVSLDPPLVGFLPGKASESWEAMADGGVFAVNVLADTQLDVCDAFFKGSDPFNNVEWTVGPSGAARLAGCPAWIDCTVHDVLDAGDHFMVLGRVTDLDCAETSEPLLFLGGGYGSFSTLGS